MNHIKVQLTGKQADGYVIPLGPVNLVNVVTDVGMVGCGAFDVAALNNFGYPAAKVRPSQGSSIATIEDLLQGIVKEVNPCRREAGIEGWPHRQRSSRIALSYNFYFCAKPERFLPQNQSLRSFE